MRKVTITQPTPGEPLEIKCDNLTYAEVVILLRLSEQLVLMEYSNKLKPGAHDDTIEVQLN